ncbi:MAG: RidA family protein [Burkholderiaceae bacterium]
MNIERVNPPAVTTPTGYSHVTVVSSARQVHVSGQVALDAAGKIVGKDNLSAQTEQVYANLVACLAAVGADLSHVFKVVTYVVNLTPERVADVRAVRNKYLGQGPYPAGTMVGVTSLVHPDLLIEIEAIAALD